MTYFLLFVFGVCLGASSAFIYAMVRIPKPPSITMHARRDQHEFVQRKYRGAEIVATVAPEVGGIDYRFINMTGLEDK